MTVSPSGNLFMRDVIISGTPNSRPGLRINGGSAWIEQSKIVNNTGGGIVVEGGGTLMLENSFVGGGNINNAPVVNVINGILEMTYSTVGAGFGTSSALSCDVDQVVTVRNSLLVSASDADELQCNSATVMTSALEMPTGDNLELGPMNANWFAGYDNGDFRLAGMSPDGLSTAAKWQAGDPPTDIEGDPRPTTDGSDDYAGADRP